MAKPIFIVGIAGPIAEKEFSHIRDNLNSAFGDYHVLVYNHSGEDTKFECFYEKDFDEVKFEELKRIVRDRTKT